MPHLVSAKPAPSDPEGTGFLSPNPLEAALARVRVWADGSLAILLSGSHAAGEAVRATVGGRTVTLSDVDVYVVMPDGASCEAARARMRADQRSAARELEALGLVAPLEVAFLTPRDLTALPARPGTLALRARGRAVQGDPAWLARVPAWTARDVSDEEIGLLLENRGFELLWARPRLAAPNEITRLEARHALLKTALELAGADELLSGEWAPSAAERVRHARERRSGDRGAQAIDALWDAALAWRGGEVRSLSPAEAADEWRRASEAWRDLWGRWSERVVGGAGTEPLARARAAARRAPPRRRLREAIFFAPRSGRGPALAARLRFAAAGTPVHRVNACAAVLIGSDAPEAGDVLAPDASRALASLGVLEAADLTSWSRAAAAAVRAWDDWCLGGTRTRVGA